MTTPLSNSRHASPRLMAVMIACLLALAFAPITGAEVHRWTLNDGSTIAGESVSFIDDTLTVRIDDGSLSQVPFEALSDADKKHLLLLEDGPRPLREPDWVPGYRARYALRVVGDLLAQDRETVIAKIPTGGWLKSDLSDLLVTTSTGKEIPLVVLSHNPLGETIIQFRRNGMDRWYWVYLYNPQAPDKDMELAARLEQYEKAAEQAGLRKMALQKDSAEKAGALRDLTAKIQQHEATLASAVTELEGWAKERPERLERQRETTAAVPPLDAAQKQAAAAHAPFEADANAKTATARELTRALSTAQTALNNATAARDAAVKAEADARTAVQRATAAVAPAQEAAATAKQAADQAEAAALAAEAQADQAKAAAAAAAEGEAKAAAERTATERTQVAAAARQQAALRATAAERAAAAVTAAQQAVQAAQADVQAKVAAIPPLEQALAAAQTEVQQRTAPAEAAEQAASEARLAAAPTAQVLQAANQALAAATSAKNAADGAVNEMNTRVAAATKVKNDNEAALATLRPQLPPVQQAAERAAAATTAAIEDSRQKDQAYYDFAYEVEPRLFREGLTVEFRSWEGDKLDGWPEVVGGLQRSENVLGNAIVGEVMQDMNPFRRNDPRNFAVSYRGYIQIDEPGFFGFFANGDDTSFFFMRGYRVYSRTGTNQPIRGRIPLFSVGTDMQLEAGNHPFELHHVVGNTPSATGLQMLLWLPPGASGWSFLPRQRIRQAMIAIPSAIEASDGRPLATFEFGMDDTLSADGLDLYLGRLAAQGRNIANAERFTWTFEDRTTRTGSVVEHIFFEEGDQVVSLKSHPNLPSFRRRINVWTPPIATSPLSLSKVVDILDKTDVTRLSKGRLADLFHFLRISDQPHRWPVVQQIAEHLLKRTDLDARFRMELYSQLMLAQAKQGRGDASLSLLDQALREIGDSRTLRAALLVEVANIYRDELRNFSDADRMYGTIIGDNVRLRHPVIRRAAIEWGDLFMQAGDIPRASESFRMARSLGTVGAALDGEGDPVKRGALLRVAEQQLREGNIRQTQRLLHRIEEEFPEQKLEGLYRYLRGESRRYAGLYELAVQDYEVLLQMPAWAGYRANAIFGITDSFLRMGEFEQALEWFENLEETFPEFIAGRELSSYKVNLQERLAAQQSDLAASSGARPALFSEVHMDFEPTAVPDNDAAAPVRLLPLNGIDGVHTVYLDARNGVTAQLPLIEMQNLPTQGSLWVEFWYRDRMGLTPPGQNRYFDVYSLDDRNNTIDRSVHYQRRTFGDWHKVVFPLKLPPTRNGRIKIVVRDVGGTLEIDGLRVQHVSDAQNTALRNFIEGADPQ